LDDGGELKIRGEMGKIRVGMGGRMRSGVKVGREVRG